MKYIIMCGGNYPHWEVPRQLTKIHGEPLVARTIRLLRSKGVELSDIFISSNDDRFGQFGVVLLKHENGFIYGRGKVADKNYWLDAFYPTDEAACYLFGDVFFSEFCIASIVNYQPGEDIMFFASAYCHGQGYPKPWAEPFAFKVWNQKRFKEGIALAKLYQDQGKFRRRPVSWELWQVLKGTKLNEIAINYQVIDDYSCDIDQYGDIAAIERFKKIHERT